MPTSSFFDPMQVGTQMGMPGTIPGSVPGNFARFPRTPVLKGGYENVYGTNLTGSVNPLTKEVKVDARAPIGDHQNQLFLTGGGFVHPADQTNPADWGVKIGIEKKIPPTGRPIGAYIDNSLSGMMGVQPAGGYPTDARARLINALTSEERQQLFQNINTERRTDIDAKLGIVPGATKFKVFGEVAPENSNPSMDPTMMMGMPGPQGTPSYGTADPNAFRRQYINNMTPSYQ